MLFGLYMTWGLFLGFFLESTKILLIKNNASYVLLSKTTLINYPFMLKFILAPLSDNYYFKSIGKRKTYIVIPNYIACFLLLLSSFYVEEWITTLNVEPITFFGFIICICISLQSLSVDAWPTHLLRSHNLRFAGSAAFVGPKFGNLFGYNIFILLHSPEFCNENFYDTPQKEGVLSNQIMVIIISTFILLVTLLIHIFKKEKDTSELEFEDFLTYLKNLKGFFYNPNIRWLMFFTLTINSFMSPIENANMVILKKGFPQTTLSTVDFITNITSAFVAMFASYLSKNEKKYTYLLYTYLALYLFDILYYFFVINYDQNFNASLAIFCYALQSAVSAYLSALNFVFFVSFVLKIIDEKMAASFAVFLYSISNFNVCWSSSLTLFLMEYISFQNLGMTSFILGLIYYALFAKKILTMDKIDKEFWKVSNF